MPAKKKSNAGRKPLPEDQRRVLLSSSTVSPQTRAKLDAIMSTGKNLGQAIDFLASRRKMTKD